MKLMVPIYLGHLWHGGLPLPPQRASSTLPAGCRGSLPSHLGGGTDVPAAGLGGRLE